MQIRFDHQTIIVAGAARGIGRAIARAFASEGGQVFACDRLVKEVESIAGPCDGGGCIHARAVDVTDPASIDKVVAEASLGRGRVDVLTYVAGGVLGQTPKPLEDVL